MTLPAATTYRRPRRTKAGIVLPRTDGRTLAARRFRSLCEAFTAELGGSENLSAVDMNLIRQAANLVLAAERFQVDVVSGADVNADALVRVSSEARRILGMLRAKARNKPAGPTLAEYLAANYPASDEEAEVAGEVDGTAAPDPEAPKPT